MTLQIDGNSPLAQQELELQSIETFFVEVVDYKAGSGIRNDVTTSSIPGAIEHSIHLAEIQNATDLAKVAGKAVSIVFDRNIFVAGAHQRVVGFRS